jgi:hypothetical protein
MVRSITHQPVSTHPFARVAGRGVGVNGSVEPRFSADTFERASARSDQTAAQHRAAQAGGTTRIAQGQSSQAQAYIERTDFAAGALRRKKLTAAFLGHAYENLSVNSRDVTVQGWG